MDSKLKWTNVAKQGRNARRPDTEWKQHMPEILEMLSLPSGNLREVQKVMKEKYGLDLTQVALYVQMYNPFV
jgi:hypothetical protein